MTRVLSELLGAREPAFTQGLLRLEVVSGHSGADIRLTAEIERATMGKLRELGLDPKDPTGAELYAALLQRIKADDARLSAKLAAKYGSANPVHANVARALDDLPMPRNCFALKTAVGRRLLKKVPPKQTMKLLGYRSLESLLRREQFVAVCAAAWIIESSHWRKLLLEHYKRLTAADFEIRPLIVIAPQSNHWQELAEAVVSQKKHNIVGLREYGAVVILPFPEHMPPAAAMTALLVAIHEINDVRACSTFLKLCQVRPDFGRNVLAILTGEPALPADILDGPVQWHIIQRYYARFGDRFREDLFEPHIQREDMSWHSVEKALSFIEPSLEFWHHTSTLGLVSESRPVSLNVIDAALNFCNQLPYQKRVAAYFQRSLWSELLIRYLKHEAVEQAILASLEARLVPAGPSPDEFDDI